MIILLPFHKLKIVALHQEEGHSRRRTHNHGQVSAHLPTLLGYLESDIHLNYPCFSTHPLVHDNFLSPLGFG